MVICEWTHVPNMDLQSRTSSTDNLSSSIAKFSQARIILLDVIYWKYDPHFKMQDIDHNCSQIAIKLWFWQVTFGHMLVMGLTPPDCNWYSDGDCTMGPYRWFVQLQWTALSTSFTCNIWSGWAGFCLIVYTWMIFTLFEFLHFIPLSEWSCCNSIYHNNTAFE